MTLNDYFDKIICINIDHRTDKWAHCQAQFERYAIRDVLRFSGYYMPKDGNTGCTAAHRGVLELINHHGWQKTLILEDDFEVVHNDMQQKFSSMIGEVPEDWDMLYLGGHYAEKPQYRVSNHVIRMGRMMTTSSYAVKHSFSRAIAPFICGIGPIDVLYYGSHIACNCYIFQPRLMVQYETFSDIQEKSCNNRPCMSDTRHENMV